MIYLANPADFLKTFISSSSTYLQMLPQIAWSIEPQAKEWTQDWSINYFIWWIAWAPFVGAFIAMISREEVLEHLFYVAYLFQRLHLLHGLVPIL